MTLGDQMLADLGWDAFDEFLLFSGNDFAVPLVPDPTDSAVVGTDGLVNHGEGVGKVGGGEGDGT